MMQPSKIKSEKVPLLTLDEYSRKISLGSNEWPNFRFKNSDLFHVNTMEDYVTHSKLKELPLPPHRKEVFDFIFLSRGTITRNKGLESYVFGKNQFFFLPAYQITTMTDISRDAAGFYCNFKEDIFVKQTFQKDILSRFSFLQFTSDPVLTVDKQSTPYILLLLQRLLDEYRKDVQCDHEFVAATLLSLFLEIQPSEEEVNSKDNAALRIANQYKKLIHERGDYKQKVNHYADMISVSPEHLNRSVKKVFGRTAHQYLDETILLEAKVLLKQSTFNIGEVGFKVGIENPGDFIRFFRSKTGVTPRQYRQKV